MKFKSLVSCFLVCALTFGLTACMGSGGSIDSVLKKYGEALNSSDARLVLLLTNWDADSDKYDEIDDYINSARLTRLSGPDCGSCSTYLASTIKLKYSKKDIEVDGDKATVNIKYELLEWNRVNGLDCGSFKKLLEEDVLLRKSSFRRHFARENSCKFLQSACEKNLLSEDIWA